MTYPALDDRRTRTTRARVLVLDPLHEEALQLLRTHYEVMVRLHPAPDELLRLVENAEVLVVRSGVRLSAEVLAAASRLRVIARAGAGTDNIDLVAARRAGIIVFTVPGGSANAVAELAIALSLALARQVGLADRLMRVGRWEKAALSGFELQDKVMGIVGLGAIGSRVAQLARGFSMRSLACVAHPNAQRSADAAEQGVELTDLDTLLRGSDIVCLSVPLNPATRGLIGAAELGLMKSSALLVNVARGPVVVEQDLLAALGRSRIGGAALDVHEQERVLSPFAALDNVVLTPHIGAMTADAQVRIGRQVAVSIEAALAGHPVGNQIC